MKLRILASAILLATLAIAQDKQDKKTKKPKEVADPVCGMMVDPATAPKTEYKGKSYYFCSLDEKTEFQKTPEKFVAKDSKETKK